MTELPVWYAVHYRGVFFGNQHPPHPQKEKIRRQKYSKKSGAPKKIPGYAPSALLTVQILRMVGERGNLILDGPNL